VLWLPEQQLAESSVEIISTTKRLSKRQHLTGIPVEIGNASALAAGITVRSSKDKFVRAVGI
jgi:hypothetical protein